MVGGDANHQLVQLEAQLVSHLSMLIKILMYLSTHWLYLNILTHVRTTLSFINWTQCVTVVIFICVEFIQKVSYRLSH